MQLYSSSVGFNMPAHQRQPGERKAHGLGQPQKLTWFSINFVSLQHATTVIHRYFGIWWIFRWRICGIHTTLFKRFQSGELKLLFSAATQEELNLAPERVKLLVNNIKIENTEFIEISDELLSYQQNILKKKLLDKQVLQIVFILLWQL